MSAAGTLSPVPSSCGIGCPHTPGVVGVRLGRSLLPGAGVTLVQVWDTVNLIRRISGEVLPVTLTDVLITSKGPAVEVRWKSNRYRYKLDLVKNEVLAIDSTHDHRQSMRAWYTISEEHRIALTELYWAQRKTGKKATNNG
jgi:hypothetical protein